MNIQILKTYSQHTTNGVVKKSLILIDNKKFLIKGNTQGHYEPYSEYMASRIAKSLGLPTVMYDIIYDINLGIEHTVGDCEHVSICEILDYEIYPYYKVVTDMGYDKFEASQLKTYINLGLDIEHLYKTLILDAFIGNPDRHLNNLDIYQSAKGELKNAPILDYGLSLYSRFGNDYLPSILTNSLGYDLSQPFKDTHKEQIDYFKKEFGVKKFFNVDKDSFFDEIFKNFEENVFIHLTDKRVEIIKQYLDIRFDEYIQPFNDEYLKWY